MYIKGTVVEVGPAEQVTQSFAKQEVIIEFASGKYTNNLALEFKDAAPAEIGEGVTGTFHLNLRSNQSKTGRWFTNAQCWKFEPESGNAQPQNQQQQAPPPPQQEIPPADDDDELPF